MKKGTSMEKENIKQAVESYISGEKSAKQLSEELDVRQSTIQLWVRKYQRHGVQWMMCTGKKEYPAALKYAAVDDYLSGKGSMNEICLKYGISTNSTLLKWIKRYNDHRDFNTYERDVFMIKGRQTEYGERVDIVGFCIANDDNYHMTCKRYQVSYQQVYAWVQKYKAKGAAGLIDRRGKGKSTDEMSETEKLSTQMKLLEAENRHLKMENDYLKKLDELGRG